VAFLLIFGWGSRNEWDDVGLGMVEGVDKICCGGDFSELASEVD